MSAATILYLNSSREIMHSKYFFFFLLYTHMCVVGRYVMYVCMNVCMCTGIRLLIVAQFLYTFFHLYHFLFSISATRSFTDVLLLLLLRSR